MSDPIDSRATLARDPPPGAYPHEPIDPGPIQVQCPLGEGGMARVWEGTQASLKRSVAVKEAKHKQLEALLVQEAWVTAALDHPAIPSVHDLVDHEGRPAVVMQRLTGTDWEALLNDPDLARSRHGDQDALAWHLGIWQRVADAVAYAHSRGIVHLDIKPENVMVGEHGEIYLVDWALAAAVEGEALCDERFPKTDKRGITGTPAFMPPEMALQPTKVDRSSDIYLLGGLLLRIVSGQPPRDVRTLDGLAEAVLRPVPVDPALPLADLITRCLAQKKADRPASVQAVQEEVRHWLAHRDARRLLDDVAAQCKALEEMQDSDADRDAVFSQFGAVQFGLREVVRRWPDAPQIDEIRRYTTLRMARWVLDSGDDQGAQALLAQIADPPTDLVEALHAAADTRARDAQELAKLRHDLDVRDGCAWRIVLAGGMAGVWVGIPVVTWLAGIPSGYPRQLTMAAAMSLTTPVVLAAAWPGLRRTRYNRILTTACAIYPLAILALLTACWVTGVDGDAATGLRLVVSATLMGMVTVHAEPRFAPALLVYMGALGAAAWAPAWADAINTAAHGFLVVNALVAWALLGIPKDEG